MVIRKSFCHLRVMLMMFFSLFLIITAYSGSASANTTSKAIPLQPIINAAQIGDSITLAPGTYLGPVQIDKRLTISGEGRATLLNSSPDAEVAVMIQADGVKLQGLNIQQHNGRSSSDSGGSRSGNFERFSHTYIWLWHYAT